MNYFEDDWGAGSGWGMDEPVAAPVETKTQQAPIGHETANKTPLTQPAQPAASSTHFDPPQQQAQPTSTSGYNFFQEDEWGDNEFTGAMSSNYANIMPESTQTTNLPQQAEVPEVQAVEETVPQKKEEEPMVVEPERSAPTQAPIQAPSKETRAPKPPAQAERNELMATSSMGEWGTKNISNLGKAPSKRRGPNRRNEKPTGRKAPMPMTQSIPPAVASQQPVGGAPSKQQVTTQPSSLPDDQVQMLMDKIQALEMKVEELENRQLHQLGGVCTLNSTGKTNHEFNVIWDSTNHIIRPQKGLKLIEPEKVLLEVSHRGLYQITFTTCGTNPQLIINGHVYAAARSAPIARGPISSTSCVNIYLYLDEKATIAGRVTDEIGSENPCEHWLCVRLVHQGF